MKKGDVIKIGQLPSLYERRYEYKNELEKTFNIEVFTVKKDGTAYALKPNKDVAFNSLAKYNGCWKITKDKIETWAWNAYPADIRNKAIEWYEQKWHTKYTPEMYQ